MYIFGKVFCGHSKIAQLFESFVFSSESVILTAWSVKPNTRYSPLSCNPEPLLAQYLPTLHYLAITLPTTISFDFQKFYMVLTLRLCFVYGPQNKEGLLPHTVDQDAALKVTNTIRICACSATGGDKRYKKPEPLPHVLRTDSVRQHLITVTYSNSTRHAPLLREWQMLLATPKSSRLKGSTSTSSEAHAGPKWIVLP